MNTMMNKINDTTVDTSRIQTIYLKNNSGLGTKSTKQLASIVDLNNDTCKKMQESTDKLPVIFYYRYRFIRLKEGIYKKKEVNYYMTYEKIRELNESDYKIIAQERQDAINHAIQRNENRKTTIQEGK